MKHSYILGIILAVCSSICLASTEAGNFIINNYSSFEMDKFDVEQYGVKKEGFPQTISANQSTTIPIEFASSWFDPHYDGSVTAHYLINCSRGVQIISVSANLQPRYDNFEYFYSFPVQSSGAQCVQTNSINTEEHMAGNFGNPTLTLQNTN